MAEETLARVLAEEDWERAARLLLAGMARAIEQLPGGSLEGLLDIIDGRDDGPRKGRRPGAGKKSH